MTLIERLRLYKPIDNTSSLINEAADLLEQQAARIAELEAENRRIADMWAASCDELRTLRRKIDEAPVVAWFSRTSHAGYGGIWNYQTDETDIPLISKEDLRK